MIIWHVIVWINGDLESSMLPVNVKTKLCTSLEKKKRYNFPDINPYTPLFGCLIRVKNVFININATQIKAKAMSSFLITCTVL